MIERDTVLVLGAGASIPYGFPSGRGMLIDICERIEKKEDNWFGLKNLIDGATWDDVKAFGQKLRRSQVPSVDKFLEFNAEYRELGKMCIALNLIPREDKNRLLKRTGEMDWYEYLFNRLIEGVEEIEDLKSNGLKIVTFNYDRSIDAYILEAFKHAFQLDREEAAEWSRQIPIVHVHGKIGELFEKTGNGRKYNPLVEDEELVEAAESIRIVDESDPYTQSKLEEAREYLAEADLVCFMGFGYHESNLDRLDLPLIYEEMAEGTPSFHGTGKGLRPAEVGRAEGLVNERLPTNQPLNLHRGKSNMDLLRDVVHLS